MIKVNTIINSSIEQLVDMLFFNEIKIDPLKSKIASSELSEDEKINLCKKLDIAYKRMIEPLDSSSKIQHFILPFGITSLFSDDIESDIKVYKKYNYRKKLRQYFWISLFGFFFYIILGITIGILI